MQSNSFSNTSIKFFLSFVFVVLLGQLCLAQQVSNQKKNDDLDLADAIKNVNLMLDKLDEIKNGVQEKVKDKYRDKFDSLNPKEYENVQEEFRQAMLAAYAKSSSLNTNYYELSQAILNDQLEGCVIASSLFGSHSEERLRQMKFDNGKSEKLIFDLVDLLKESKKALENGGDYQKARARLFHQCDFWLANEIAKRKVDMPKETYFRIKSLADGVRVMALIQLQELRAVSKQTDKSLQPIVQQIAKKIREDLPDDKKSMIAFAQMLEEFGQLYSKNNSNMSKLDALLSETSKMMKESSKSDQEMLKIMMVLESNYQAGRIAKLCGAKESLKEYQKLSKTLQRVRTECGLRKEKTTAEKQEFLERIHEKLDQSFETTRELTANFFPLTLLSRTPHENSFDSRLEFIQRQLKSVGDEDIANLIIKLRRGK